VAFIVLHRITAPSGDFDAGPRAAHGSAAGARALTETMVQEE